MPRFKIDAWLARPTSKLAVVGAGGWVGRAAVASVLAAAPGISSDRLRLFASRERTDEIGGRAMRVEALDPAARLGPGEWIVVHAGVIGGDASAGGEVRSRNDAMLQAVLAMSEAAEVRRVVLVSSGAAGRVEAMAPSRTAYAAMKRAHEEAAAAWRDRTGGGLLVPRVFNLGGPFMTLPHTYALGDFILALQQQGRINIGARDPVFRSYVHVREMTDLFFEMALDEREDATPFDVGGAEIIELGALARRIAAGLGRPDAAITRAAPGQDGAADWYVGDARRYQSALFRMGREPRSLNAIIGDTIDWLSAADASDQGQSPA